MDRSESNRSPISDRELLGAGWQRVGEAWLPPQLPRSHDAARKAKHRKRRKEASAPIQQINVEIPADLRTRAAFRNLAKALRYGQVLPTEVEALLSVRPNSEDDSSITLLLHEATMLTVAEAAYVADVTVRAVNRAVDEEKLPRDLYRRRNGSREISSMACPFLEFYFKTRFHLAAQARTGIISSSWRSINDAHRAGQPRGGDGAFAISREGCLTVDLTGFCDSAVSRLAKLKASLDLITEPGRPGGTPKIRGTDLSPYDVAAAMAQGTTCEEVLSIHPELNREAVE